MNLNSGCLCQYLINESLALGVVLYPGFVGDGRSDSIDSFRIPD